MTYRRDDKGRFVKGTEQPHGFEKGHRTWNKGIPWDEETKRKMSKSRQGKNRLKINLNPSPSLSYIIGVLLGDGEILKDGIRFQQTKHEFAEEFVNHTKRIGFNPFYANSPSVLKKGQIRVNASSRSFVEWFNDLSYKDTQEWVKDFPFWFLKGFYESDGSIGPSNIEFRNRNFFILHIVNYLLKKNGFETSWGEYKTPAGKPYYCVRVLGGRVKTKELIKLMNPCIKRGYQNGKNNKNFGS